MEADDIHRGNYGSGDVAGTVFVFAARPGSTTMGNTAADAATEGPRTDEGCCELWDAQQLPSEELWCSNPERQTPRWRGVFVVPTRSGGVVGYSAAGHSG
ncbi:MAG: hypothetical protein ACRBN8_15560 [Nannocystales bacterium]